MMKDVMTGAYIKDEKDYSFEFGTDLFVADKLKFVNSISSVVVDDVNYNSIIRNLVTDFFIVDIFTNVDVADLKKSLSFIDDVEVFLEDNNIVDIVKANAKEGLFDELNKAIDDNIEYRTGIHKNALNDALTGLVNTFEKKLNDIDLANILEVMESFGGITDDFTPQNIVNAYMNTDVAKKNIKELNETKKQSAEFVDEISKAIDVDVNK